MLSPIVTRWTLIIFYIIILFAHVKDHDIDYCTRLTILVLHDTHMTNTNTLQSLLVLIDLIIPRSSQTRHLFYRKTPLNLIL